jgi:hypothetical protein
VRVGKRRAAGLRKRWQFLEPPGWVLLIVGLVIFIASAIASASPAPPTATLPANSPLVRIRSVVANGVGPNRFLCVPAGGERRAAPARNMDRITKNRRFSPATLEHRRRDRVAFTVATLVGAVPQIAQAGRWVR